MTGVLEDLIRDLCRIPAPSGLEDARAEFCRAWFEENVGAAYIDEAKNVICSLGDADADELVIFMAHTDTVFPDREPMKMEQRGSRLYCPGVGDDTANLAMLMLAAKHFASSGRKPKCGILFVADSCEEGLGNLKGCRALIERYGARVREVISFDLNIGQMFTRAVGSARWRITVRAEGGHSLSDFGNRNAIAEAAALITALYAQPLPAAGITTYNVGTITGGTSVNTIAERAEFLYEYRSDLQENLNVMEQQMRCILQNTGDVTCELLGIRPGMGVCRDPMRQADLIHRAEQAVAAAGVKVTHEAGSTDCNIPFSMGIPTLCMGLIESGGTHTRDEWLDLDSLPRGMEVLLRFLDDYFAS